MRQLGSILLAALAVLALVGGVGFLLPPEHASTREVLVPVPPERVWAVLADFPRHSAWRDDVQRLQALPDRNGHPAWRELTSDGERTFEVTAYEPGSRLALAFTDDRHWFRGTWSLDLRDERGGTKITLTESGVIDNAIMRVYCGTIHDRGEALTTLLRDLGGVLGHDVEPQDPTLRRNKGEIDTLF